MHGISARLWGLAIISGLLQTLPFPLAGPVPLWRTAICWVALLPLLYALLAKRDGTAGGGPGLGVAGVGVLGGATLGYVSGIVWYLGNCYWIYPTMYLYGGLARPVAGGILILFCLYLGLYHALFGAVIAAVGRSRAGRQGALLLTPFAWVAVELARARVTGLPWDLLGVCQVSNPVLIRIAPYTGAYGLSFVIAAVNAAWLLRVTVRQRRWTRPALTTAGVLIVVGYVFTARQVKSPAMQGANARATLLQENLEVGAAATGPPETAERLLNSFSRLSLQPARMYLRGIPELAGTRPALAGVPGGAAGPTDLIVWPESPAPFEEGDEQFRAGMSRVARAAGAPVIVGNVGLERSADLANKRGYDLRNAASFVGPDGSFAGRYDKMHLVPFGEYVPFKRLFFFAGNLLAEVGTFEPGRRRTVFSSAGHRYGVFICYESIFGDEVREFVKSGAEVLVNISNDGWYGDTSAPWQHLDMVRMRAIENHRWVLRSTNTGVTAAIDPFGRVTASVPRHIRTAVQVRFGYEHDLTFYTRYGDVFAYVCTVLTIAALLWSLRNRNVAPMH